MADLAQLGLAIRSDGVVVAKNRLNDFSRAGRRAEQQTNRVGTSAARSMVKFVSLTAAVTALASATKSVITTYAGFDQAMRNVQSVTGGTAEDFKRLSDAAREQARVSVFTAREAAQAQYYLASAGMSVNQVIEAQKGVMQLAAATQSDLASTSATVAATLSQFSLKAGEAERVSNVFAAAISGSQANMEKLSYAMRYAGPIAGALGMSLEQTTGHLMALFNAGYEGSQAGTLLQGALARLLDITPKASKVIHSLGMEIYDSSGKLKSFDKILDELARTGASTADIIKIFGRVAGKGVVSMLAQGGDAIRDYTKKVTGTNAASKQVETQMKGLINQFKLFTSATEEASIALGEKMAPAIREVVTESTALMNLLGKAIESGSWADFYSRLLFGTATPMNQADAKAQLERLREWKRNAEEAHKFFAAPKQTIGGVLGWVQGVIASLGFASGYPGTGSVNTLDQQIKAIQAYVDSQAKSLQNNADLNLLGVGLPTYDFEAEKKRQEKLKALRAKARREREASAEAERDHHFKLQLEMAKATGDSLKVQMLEDQAFTQKWIKEGGTRAEADRILAAQHAAAARTASEEAEKALMDEVEAGIKLSTKSLDDYTKKEKAKAEATYEYELAMAKATGNSLRVRELKHKKFVKDWTARSISRTKAEALWQAQHLKSTKSMLAKTLDAWMDTDQIIEDATERSVKAMYDTWEGFLFTLGEEGLDNLGSQFEDFFHALGDAWWRLLIQMVAQWSMSGMAGLLKDLLGLLKGGEFSFSNTIKGFGLGDLLGGGKTGLDIYSGISGGGLSGMVEAVSSGGLTGLAGYLGLGASGWAGTTGALMATGPAATAAAEAALAAGVEAALTASATSGGLMGAGGSMWGMGLANLGMGGGAAAGAGAGAAATAGLSAMAAPMALALGPGMLGMALSSLGFGVSGPMTPEEAKSNWEGQVHYIETVTAKMQELGQTLQGFQGEGGFGMFSQDARDMADDFERLGTVAGYTDEQLEAVKSSLSPMARQMLESGEAANTLADSVQGLVAQISAERDNYTLITPVVNDYNKKIDKLAASLGLTGGAADHFRNKIWELSRTFTTGGEEAWGFGNSLDQFVADTLGTITDAAGGTTEAIRNLIDSMNGVPGAAAKLSGVGVKDLGNGITQFTAIDYAPSNASGSPVLGNAALGYYHEGGPVEKLHTGGPVAYLHSGGVWPELKPNERRAVLLDDEWVMRGAAVKKYGREFMADVNAGRYQAGGTVVKMDVGGVQIIVPGADLTQQELEQAVENALAKLASRGVKVGTAHKTEVPL